MLVVIIYGKIIYGTALANLTGYIANTASAGGGGTVRGTVAFAGLAASLNVIAGPPLLVREATAGAPIDRNVVTMSDDQFIRFKSAGRRHAESSAKKNASAISTGRVDRTSDDLAKWDVGRYSDLSSKRGGPWGGGHATNRDHLLAHAENLEVLAHTGNPYGATSVAELKQRAWAVTISGNMHRGGSMTYGGNAGTNVAALKGRFGVTIPTTPAEDANLMRDLATGNMHKAARMETEALLQHKANRAGRHNNPTTKTGSTLRIEMVGAYAYLYKQLIEQGIMRPDADHDAMLLRYLALAVTHDDGYWRIDPQAVGRLPINSINTTSGTKYLA